MSAVYIKFIRHAVLASVCSLIDVAVVANLAKQFLNALFVAVSVVRMKSSFEMPIRFHSCRNSAEISSAYCCGVFPAACAARSIFCPCSSVPVRKKVSAPSSPLPPRNSVAGNGRISMPNVRASVYVVNRRRDVELPGHGVVSTAALRAKM